MALETSIVLLNTYRFKRQNLSVHTHRTAQDKELRIPTTYKEIARNHPSLQPRNVRLQEILLDAQSDSDE